VTSVMLRRKNETGSPLPEFNVCAKVGGWVGWWDPYCVPVTLKLVIMWLIDHTDMVTTDQKRCARKKPFHFVPVKLVLTHRHKIVV